VTERRRQLLRVAAVCLLLGDLVAQVTRGVWNMAAGAGTSTDWITFAAAARLVAHGSSCLYYARCIVASQAAYMGQALSSGAARDLGATTLPSGAAYSPFVNPPPAAAVLVPLAVLPPTVGFIGKLFLITAAWNHGYNWLVVTLAVNSAFAIYYYLSLVRHAYTEETVAEGAAVPDTSAFSLVGAGVLSVLVLALGLIPSPVFEFAITAGRGLFK